MTDNRLKTVNLRVPIDLLDRASKVRAAEGISVTFQFTKGLEMYLDKKAK